MIRKTESEIEFCYPKIATQERLSTAQRNWSGDAGKQLLWTARVSVVILTQPLDAELSLHNFLLNQPKSAMSAGIFFQRGEQLRLAEIGPKRFSHHKLCVGNLPQ